MKRKPIIAIATIWFVFVGSIAVGRDKQPDKPGTPESSKLTADDRELFKWFDSLGFPDLKKCNLVKVTCPSTAFDSFFGRPLWSHDGLLDPPSHLAFLEKDERIEFSVFTPLAAALRFKKTGKESPIRVTASFQDVDLKAEAEKMLQRIRQRKPSEEFVPEYVFVMARASAARGYDDLASQFLDAAKTVPNGWWPQPPRGPAPRPLSAEGLRQKLANEMPRALFGNTISAYSSFSITRQEMLEMLTSIEKYFPQAFVIAELNPMKRILEKMIAEDAQRAKKTTKPPSESRKQELIEDLIYQLREQTITYQGYRGFPDFFSNQLRPAYRLREMGYDAVPYLIESWDDKRITRASPLSRGATARLFTVGNCCQEIVRAITGKTFQNKEAAQAWWQESQNKGEKQVLIEGTEAGDASSPAVAERLLKKYPDTALASIIKGAQRSKNGSVRSQLVRIAAKLKGDEAFRFLRDESKGPWFESRYEAANALLASGRDEGVLAMIQEWNNIPLAQDLRIEHWGITDFLAWSGKPEAIAALANNLRQRDVGVRSIVIMAFRQSPPSADPAPKPMPDAITKAADQLLVNELDDRDRGVKLIPSGAFKNPRICDLSAYVLTKRWGRVEQFSESDSEKTLDARIEVLKGVWRRRAESKP